MFVPKCQRSIFGSTVCPIKILRPLYFTKLLILPARACFQPKIRKYLSTIDALFSNSKIFLYKENFLHIFCKYLNVITSWPSLHGTTWPIGHLSCIQYYISDLCWKVSINSDKYSQAFNSIPETQFPLIPPWTFEVITWLNFVRH